MAQQQRRIVQNKISRREQERIEARKAKESFEKIIGQDVEMGMFSGNDRELGKPYLFATVQTLSREEQRALWHSVIDEIEMDGLEPIGIKLKV